MLDSYLAGSAMRRRKVKPVSIAALFATYMVKSIDI